jgi:hypothetical protein
MKLRIVDADIELEIDYGLSAEKVISQLQVLLSKYGEGNVVVIQRSDPYDSYDPVMCMCYREETDDEYEKRIAHETWRANRKREQELKMLAQLRAKYEKQE